MYDYDSNDYDIMERNDEIDFDYENVYQSNSESASTIEAERWGVDT